MIPFFLFLNLNRCFICYSMCSVPFGCPHLPVLWIICMSPGVVEQVEHIWRYRCHHQMKMNRIRAVDGSWCARDDLNKYIVDGKWRYFSRIRKSEYLDLVSYFSNFLNLTEIHNFIVRISIADLSGSLER